MDPVIDVLELSEELRGPAPPTLVEVRWVREDPPGNSRGHIPGAYVVDLETELAGPAGLGGRHPLPSPCGFEETMRRAGVSMDRPVVVYDAGNAAMIAAARAWWMLRWAGHGNVRVLDGGMLNWSVAGHLVVPEPEPAWGPGDFIVRPGAMRVLDADQAAVVARAGLLLDARAPERYRGDFEPYDAMGGHIPGAVSAPAAQNVDEKGRFLTASALRDRFASLGAETAPEVATYCGSGVRASQQVLALERAGIPSGLYVGSWSDWSADPTRPVATGFRPC
ncbi:sulfurtransferase [Streptomyces actinomycinicus]|uniref:Sulfurtransferase n=1 Tax=Streptomyces actinomycinicus TaxID=1695166 RepID=A0A937ER18_9ACTN|nr:sulfurtransferase [Streptomyces actinomycinicus]MBL1087561.1 sulfurtransferase [Streptomyces actinomycinicus]